MADKTVASVVAFLRSGRFCRTVSARTI